MPEVAVVNSDGAEVGKLSLSPEVFEVEPNESIVHSSVVNHLNNLRQGTSDTKTRAEVRGGGKKPWRQKGTGRARQGSIRAPHWYHGGVVFGPHPKDYDAHMPKKMRRLALRSALSARMSEGRIKVLDALELDAISTKALVSRLETLEAEGKTLLVVARQSEVLTKSARNIPWLMLRVAPCISTYEVLDADTLIFTQEAIGKMQEVESK